MDSGWTQINTAVDKRSKVAMHRARRMNRRDFMGGLASSGAAHIATGSRISGGLSVRAGNKYDSLRPPSVQRKFVSPAVERQLETVKSKIGNEELKWLFENCYPNTLDTTLEFGRTSSGDPDTFVITGDIAAMWLRDSTAQTSVYLPVAKDDLQLREMFRGLMGRQARCILLDSYANAFYATPKLGDFQNDVTEMKPGIHERKWEIDSLCYPIRLAALYWERTHDAVPFDQTWRNAASQVIHTLVVQQRLHDEGPYRFQRLTTMFYDNSPNKGLGNPTKKVGMIHSAFRPSDDACIMPFLIPSNLFALQAMKQLRVLARDAFTDREMEDAAARLQEQLEAALIKCATATHPTHGRIYAYEVDGFGNNLLMDDANAPGLLSLPYLDCCNRLDPLYLRTRSFCLSVDNPYFLKGKFAEGIGGPHAGPGTIWPLSIIMRAITSQDSSEIVTCLRMLMKTHAGTGFMHESFDPNAPDHFTRSWFAWCNSLFGELIVTLAETHPEILKQI